MKNQYRIAALALCLAAALPMAGCGIGSTEQGAYEIKVNQTVSSDSRWIDSTIEGAIDETVQTSEKDDFYTASNREWLLSEEATEQDPYRSGLMDNFDILRERLVMILNGTEDPEAMDNEVEIPENLLKHDEDLVARLAELASNWEDRDAQGAEPLRPYVEDITGISSIEEMTDWLVSGRKFSSASPLKFEVGVTYTDHDVNTVLVEWYNTLSLNDGDDYTNLSTDGRKFAEHNRFVVETLMQRLGFSKKEAEQTLKQCYRFETKLVEALENSSKAKKMEEAIEEQDNRLSLEELEELQGDYPLTQKLAACGYDRAETFSVAYPKYVAALGRLYNEKNLEDMKSYFLVHTLLDGVTLLDREMYDEIMDFRSTLYDITDEEEEDLSEEEKEAELILGQYIKRYLSVPLEQIYVARYCDPDQKQAVLEMTEDFLKEYETIFNEEEWLTEETRAAAVEKLRNITVRAVYPDTFDDCTDLDLSGCDNLVDAAAEINTWKVIRDAGKINAPADRLVWDLEQMPTADVNCYYNAMENSINILAGYLCSEESYSPSFTYEQLLARLGTTIGHEITHGFDTEGSEFDKDGYMNDWWTKQDKREFRLRADTLARSYSGLIPYPGATGYSGTTVQGEAIADMGGMKCALSIAKSMPEFDYEEFFHSYANLWASKKTYAFEASCASDSHPLDYLRVNVTLQQFQEFQDTFDIQEGDGMYLAPEDRINVW